jgi:hypothetical protein
MKRKVRISVTKSRYGGIKEKREQRRNEKIENSDLKRIQEWERVAGAHFSEPLLIGFYSSTEIACAGQESTASRQSQVSQFSGLTTWAFSSS